MLKFALAGNPNCGKTTLFNSLTGSTAHVGNWPGVTVDKKEGIYKKLSEPVAVVDLPGIYSLSPYTEEEVVARNFILDEKPDCVIDIIDATNLERNLYLTTQLLEIDVPIVIALNMMDAVEKRGDKIDAKELEKRLGVPVVSISALKSSGIDKLMEKAFIESKSQRIAQTVIEEQKLKHLISDIKIALDGQGVKDPLFHAVKLAELDDIEVLMHKDTVKMVENFKEQYNNELFGDDFEALIADSRYKYITKYFSPTIKRKNEEKFVVTPSDKADKILTHKIWSIPIFLVILFAIFHLTFGEDFLFLGGIFKLPSLQDLGLIKDGKPFNFGVSLLSCIYDGKVYSVGVFLTNLINLLTGFLSNLISGLLSSSPSWVSGLICDGVLGGLFAIIGFLPQILTLFLLFSILEDSGYMARIAFILDRPLKKIGLSGRAFLPMIMGFGCSVPAIINTRTLVDEKEKKATIRVIPFFSCGAKLPILTAVAGAVMAGKGNADFITYSMYLLGIVVAMISIIFMRATTLKGDTPPFIMELPSYHLPQVKNLLALIWDKAKHFIKKAFTIILASTIVIWFLTHFNFSYEYVDNAVDTSILASFGKLLQPLFTPLGFGSQLNNFGWVFIVAAICGLVAKENVIAVLGTLAGCIVGVMAQDESGVSYVLSMISQTGITVPALISFVAFNMLTIPCMATVATAKGELKKSKFSLTLLFWIFVSYLTGTIVYTVGTFWWTLFIWIFIFLMAIFIIRAINRKNSKKRSNDYGTD